MIFHTMARHNVFGSNAEGLAAAWLEARGWTVLHRNWRWRHKEIDLIVRQGTLVAFVEVRARRGAAYGHPLETLGSRKRRDLEAAARVWIARHGGAADEYRLDAVAVLDASGTGAAATARVEHVPGAWYVW